MARDDASTTWTDSERARLADSARDLLEFTEQMKKEMAAHQVELDALQRRNRFFSRDRKHLWQMSVWLWMPLVLAMIGLFFFALFAVAERP